MHESHLFFCEDSRAQVLGLQFIKKVSVNTEHCYDIHLHEYGRKWIIIFLYKQERTVRTNMDLGVFGDMSTNPGELVLAPPCWQKGNQNSVSPGPQSPLSIDLMVEMTQTSRLTSSLTDRGGDTSPDSAFCKWSRIFYMGTSSLTHLIWTPKLSVGIKSVLHVCCEV